MLSADEVIRQLKLEPHPEGGHYRETFRDAPLDGARSASTAIYYLLAQDEVSYWHRVDAIEIWHWYGGAPLGLSIAAPDKPSSKLLLGGELQSAQHPQIMVPKYYWQSARSLGEWTLVGCTVAPGFEFSGFEMAPDGWEPPSGS
jgi:predicted cupin superfamily sugar epimerase